MRTQAELCPAGGDREGALPPNGGQGAVLAKESVVSTLFNTASRWSPPPASSYSSGRGGWWRWPGAAKAAGCETGSLTCQQPVERHGIEDDGEDRSQGRLGILYPEGGRTDDWFSKV